jgi:Ankyrin repeats (many copies)
MSDAALMTLVRTIVTADNTVALHLLAANTALAEARFEIGATRQAAETFYLNEIGHYIYSGDTALHVAAAAYRQEMVLKLIATGANVRARNRRGAEPLHYAVDGMPGSRRWNPHAQAATVARLIAAGADPNATDKSGVTPLHRAVRTRCAAAVKALLEGGADPRRKNNSGSTPILLATQNTGRWLRLIRGESTTGVDRATPSGAHQQTNLIEVRMRKRSDGSRSKPSPPCRIQSFD